MSESNEILSVEGQLVGMPLAGPESFSQQQLAYLKQALGVDETELWSGTMSGNLPTSIQLSEPATNFEYIRIQLGGDYKTVFTYSSSATSLQAVSPYVNNGVSFYCLMFAIDSLTHQTLSLPSGHASYFVISSNAITGYANRSAQNVGEMQVTRVVGIHRIAGGN